MRKLECVAKKSVFTQRQSSSEYPYNQVYQIQFYGDSNPDYIEEPLFLTRTVNTPVISTNSNEDGSCFDTSFVMDKRSAKDVQPGKIQAVPSLLLEDNAYPAYTAPLIRGALPKYPNSTEPELTSIFFNFGNRGTVKSLYFDRFEGQDFIGIK